MHPHTPSEHAAPAKLAVRVPASTSNLGPGFDFLGLALGLWLEVELTRGEGHEEPEDLQGHARAWPRGGTNLFVRALERVYAARGQRPPPYAWRARSEIPLARGLGSSGAAIAAGLRLGDALGGFGATSAELLELGLELEGHPDNSSAALLGGCTLAVPIGAGRLRVVAAEVSPRIGFALAWGAEGLATERARAALPTDVPFRDAVENPRRLALLLEGLRHGDAELLALGIEDRLHVRHRLPLIAGGERALAAARAAGAWAATISGSGSALIALAPRERAEQAAAAMAAELEAATGSAEARVVELVVGAPRVVQSRA